MTTTADVFEANRSTLLGLAYRLLGSMRDAEDVVQDVYLRWVSAARDDVHDSRAYLMTTVTHLCMDQRTSARASRETYPGPWLPEPVATERLGPLESAELRDTVSYATLHMMERLNAAERAVFVLRHAFRYPYDDIAPVVGTSAASCRQLYRRAVHELDDGAGRFTPGHSDHAAFLTAFVSAARAGDVGRLAGLLSEDVVAWNDDGGRRARDALQPILGRDRVIAFVLGLTRRYSVASGRLLEANGETAMHIAVDGSEQYVAVDVRDDQITGIYAVLNPDKLTRLGATKQASVA